MSAKQYMVGGALYPVQYNEGSVNAQPVTQAGVVNNNSQSTQLPKNLIVLQAVNRASTF